MGLVPQSHADPTAVWTEDGLTLAWGWLDQSNDLSLQLDPACPDLADDVLAWAEQVAGGPVTVTISEAEQHVADALVRRGFVPAHEGPFFACLTRALEDVPDVPPMPPGYTIRAQYNDVDVARRVAVHRAAWSSEDITVERHMRMRETWPYRGEFDLMAVSPEGQAVAYCQGWYDETNGIGLFEPVGTHPDHRRLGLARAVGTAVLRAFAAAGGRSAMVCPRGDADYPVPKLIYESLGVRSAPRPS
ncbi:hypothetical protein [Nonomuraea sediminis]|uniref:hypothetical protein n=1 Tax=Nonomuraea sediminis TaxID=2835864 RepID=UPI001BDBD215|nr:hypothetical protein [Nonomuraea sediminis]